jgi:hypothetical protein
MYAKGGWRKSQEKVITKNPTYIKKDNYKRRGGAAES